MTTREGKALNFISVPADYAGGIQEGAETPIRIIGGSGGGTALGIGTVDPIVWQYDGAATPPTTAATLQAAADTDTAVAVGHLCITSNGDIYKCTDASNQAALVWVSLTAKTIAGYIVANGASSTMTIVYNNTSVTPTISVVGGALARIGLADTPVTSVSPIVPIFYDGSAAKIYLPQAEVTTVSSITTVVISLYDLAASGVATIPATGAKINFVVTISAG